MAVGDEPWPGEVVRDVLGLVLGPDEEAEPLSGLVGLALRRNPRRAHLPVSRVLGKHIPVAPARLRAAAEALGHRAAQCLDADPVAWGDPVVVGHAENATALAHLVADTLDADHVVSTTRRTAGGGRVLVAFDEEHSHAPRHVLLPDEPERWTPDRPLVLVDDELSTGRTVAVTLRLLHRLLPRHRYVIAALADLRGPDDDAIARAACELGVRVTPLPTPTSCSPPTPAFSRSTDACTPRAGTPPTSPSPPRRVCEQGRRSRPGSSRRSWPRPPRWHRHVGGSGGDLRGAAENQGGDDRGGRAVLVSGPTGEHEAVPAADRLGAGGDARVVRLEGEAVGAPEVVVGHPEPVGGGEQVVTRDVRPEPTRHVEPDRGGHDQSAGLGIDHTVTVTESRLVRAARRRGGDPL